LNRRTEGGGREGERSAGLTRTKREGQRTQKRDSREEEAKRHPGRKEEGRMSID